MLMLMLMSSLLLDLPCTKDGFVKVHKSISYVPSVSRIN